jgi:hypothetical protein
LFSRRHSTLSLLAPDSCAVFEIARTVAHCTLGDILIGFASLMLALILGREGALAQWRWRRIVVLVLILGSGYTAFSEFLNTTLFRWTYSEAMPTLTLAGIEIGLSPLLQWFIVPPLALYLAARHRGQFAHGD